MFFFFGGCPVYLKWSYGILHLTAKQETSHPDPVPVLCLVPIVYLLVYMQRFGVVYHGISD